MFNPGWIDLQVNGHNGVDYSDPSLTADKFLKSAEELLATGTAVFLPTIITGPLDVTCRNASIILETVEKHGLSEAIPGFHFEGPFISPKPGAVGAHNPACVCLPTKENIDRLRKGSCSLANSVIYIELLGELEKLGDHLSNIAERTPEIQKHYINL